MVSGRRELQFRMRMPGTLARVQYDSRLAAGDTSGVRAALEADDLAFASSEHLLDGATLMDAYLGPLLGALTPAVWAQHAVRPAGVIVYTFGRCLPGASGEAVEPLQALPLRTADKAVLGTAISPAACADAIEWWVSKIDKMLGVLTDPAVFTDAAGNYSSAKHIQGLSTVEQLFRRVCSLQAAHRDLEARRVLLFSTLDTVQRLTAQNIEGIASLKFATTTLHRLEQAIPEGAKPILLPAAARAVEALRQVQYGFYVARQAGATSIDVLDRGRVIEKMSLEAAAAEYVKLLRNATHGFGSNRANAQNRVKALMAHHTGEVPPDLSLLGYLYLLDLLIDPDRLRRVLYRNGEE
ncbi:hypothetical protein BJP25_11600 [Actinokineospora bangkokensis]|uniref:Uncharacterized protein n=1 Tax=Actinokineospora bangkokensis TaxID=1193682 RepID=A0A1Q9LQU1_9PSEU|nr:hypothetical protein BJP25_11600 [Actinokineospora bangkokensis]